jgi:hypothetical protein
MKITYHGLEFDSEEELCFYAWCIEARREGIITEFEYKPPSIEIYPTAKYTFNKQLKTKVKVIEGTLLQDWNYSVDFKVYGDLSAFYTGINKLVPTDGVYWIDTKGTYSLFKDTEKFPLIQKALYHSKGIYANKLIPHKFFSKSWLPKPILQKGDPMYTDYKVLKNGTVKKQVPRSKYKKCKQL